MVYQQAATDSLFRLDHLGRHAYTFPMRLGLLPSAGMATRMHGIPKFLLPVSNDWKCLLDYHVHLMSDYVDRIIIPTRSEWVELLRSFNFGEAVTIVPLNTETMAETVRRALHGIDYDSCVLGMPDTYFIGGNPYRDLYAQHTADVSLSVFPTRGEQSGRMGSVKIDDSYRVEAHADKDPDHDYGTHWGVIEFTSEVEKLLDPRATTGGYLITEALQKGLDVRGYPADYSYYDCGTVDEYVECLTRLHGAYGYADRREVGAGTANS